MSMHLVQEPICAANKVSFAVWPDGLSISKYLAIYNNDNVLKILENLAKYVQKFAQILTEAFQMAKVL